MGGIVLSILLGQGEFKYRVVEDWAKLPDQWCFMDVAGVAVNSKDEVYVFNRGEHPMIIFDIHGNFLRSWGENLFLTSQLANHSGNAPPAYIREGRPGAACSVGA